MKFTRHLFGYAPVKLIATLCSFGGIYVYTRLLGADQYGRYALMFSVLALLHTLSLTWVEAASYRFGGQLNREKDYPDHFKTALVLFMRSMIVALFLIAILIVVTWNSPNYRAIVPYIALLLPLNTLIKIALEAHKAQQRVTRYMVSATTKISIGFIVGVLLAWKTGLGAAAPFAGLLTGALVLILFEGRWVISQAMRGSTDRATQRAWASFGIPTAFALSLDLLLSSVDRFFIVYFIDEAAVGSYAAGYGVADKTVLVIISWIAMAGSPLLMNAYERGTAEEVRESARHFITLLLLIGMPVAFGLALVAEPLADAMIGADLREDAKSIIPWIAFSGLLNGLLIHYFSESYQLSKQTMVKALLMLIPLAINIVLNFILIPRFGLMGAVAATLLSYIIAIVIIAHRGRHLVALPFPAKRAALITLACVSMVPIVFINLGWGAWVDLFVKSAIGAGIYILIVVGFNIAQSRTWLAGRYRQLKQ